MNICCRRWFYLLTGIVIFQTNWVVSRQWREGLNNYNEQVLMKHNRNKIYWMEQKPLCRRNKTDRLRWWHKLSEASSKIKHHGNNIQGGRAVPVQSHVSPDVSYAAAGGAQLNWTMARDMTCCRWKMHQNKWPHHRAWRDSCIPPTLKRSQATQLCTTTPEHRCRKMSACSEALTFSAWTKGSLLAVGLRRSYTVLQVSAGGQRSTAEGLCSPVGCPHCSSCRTKTGSSTSRSYRYSMQLRFGALWSDWTLMCATLFVLSGVWFVNTNLTGPPSVIHFSSWLREWFRLSLRYR